MFLVTVFKCPEAALHTCSSENVCSTKTQQFTGDHPWRSVISIKWRQL